MAYTIDFNYFNDERGVLTVVDNVLPFDIKRIYYITNVAHLKRGGHRHLELTEAIIAVTGSFTAFVDNGVTKQEFLLDTQHKCLIIEVGDWHHFYNFSEGAMLLALASTHYNKDDYIFEPYTY